MLMRFSVANFMSFGYKLNENGVLAPTEYHLYAGRSEQHSERILRCQERKVLKFSSIYGANASGKSNLIRAVDAGKRIVLNTMDGVDFADKFCKSDSSNAENPTYFEYEFTIGEKCLAYGFTVCLKDHHVLSEWLYEISTPQEHVIFERVVAEDEYYFDEAMFCEEKSIQQFRFFIEDANRIQHTLLLYEIKRRNMREKGFDIFNQVFDWFRYHLVLVYPDTKIGESFLLFQDSNKNLTDILKYLDTGITDYDLREINETAFKEYFSDEELADTILKGKNYGKRKGIFNIGGTLLELDYDGAEQKKITKLMFQHGKDDGKYEYGEESDGTQRLIELLAVILDDDEEKVFMIDELDRSLHPQMTIKFVETFLKFSAEKATQMIITTHESNLMDLNILRRDEIWFAEKEQDNSTILYTLEKFKIRYDKVVAKDYLAGRYGAVPVFQDFEYVWGEGGGFEKVEFEDTEKI